MPASGVSGISGYERHSTFTARSGRSLRSCATAESRCRLPIQHQGQIRSKETAMERVGTACMAADDACRAANAPSPSGGGSRVDLAQTRAAPGEQDGRPRSARTAVAWREPMNQQSVLAATALAASALLMACETPPTKETSGTVVGAVVGGLAGSAIGEGSGRTAAIIVGALAGGALGKSVGRSMDDTDRLKTAHALESSPTGTPTSWRNPD